MLRRGRREVREMELMLVWRHEGSDAIWEANTSLDIISGFYRQLPSQSCLPIWSRQARQCNTRPGPAWVIQGRWDRLLRLRKTPYGHPVYPQTSQVEAISTNLREYVDRVSVRERIEAFEKAEESPEWWSARNRKRIVKENTSLNLRSSSHPQSRFR